MTISKELERGLFPNISITVSHETIYRAIYAHGQRGLVKGLCVGLHRKRRCRKKRQPKDTGEPQKIGALGRYNKISDRPEVASQRNPIRPRLSKSLVGRVPKRPWGKSHTSRTH